MRQLKKRKMKKNNTLLYVAFILAVLILGGYYVHKHYNLDDLIIRTDTIYNTTTDTIYYTDTLSIIKSKPVYITHVKTDTLYTEKGDTVQLITENKTYNDTICAQNDTAIVMNYISGINANLDSTKIQINRREIIKTNTVEITKFVKKKQRFSISPQLGVGYGLINRKPDIYAGFGISVNF